MNALYPAKSDVGLIEICDRVAVVFALPPFKPVHHSKYLETMQSASAIVPFQITVTQYFGSVTGEEATHIGQPDFWNLAWRASVGLYFNYQVAISHEAVTRNQRRRIARKLRSIFAEIRLHGGS